MAECTAIAQRGKRVIVQTLQLRIDPDQIADDEMLFGRGIGADSTAILDILFALEDEFGIEVDDEDLRPDLFGSVGALTDYIKQRKAKDAGPTEAILISTPDEGS